MTFLMSLNLISRKLKNTGLKLDNKYTIYRKIWSFNPHLTQTHGHEYVILKKNHGALHKNAIGTEVNLWLELFSFLIITYPISNFYI